MKGLSMAQLARGLKSDKSQKREAITRSSEWGRCGVIGCPMPDTAKPEGGKGVCAYHHGEDHNYYQEVTIAIKEFAYIHNKLCEMNWWSPKVWKEKWPLMTNWDWCPMERGEEGTPNVYMNRIRKKLMESIKNRASELISGGN